MKHSRSRSVSRVIPKKKHITIDDFLPSDEALLAETARATIIELSSESDSESDEAINTLDHSGSKPKRSCSLKRITLADLVPGNTIFLVKRKKKSTLKYYWKNSELLKLYVVFLIFLTPLACLHLQKINRQGNRAYPFQNSKSDF